MIKVKKGTNDLATVAPELLNEWNYNKNGDLTPFDISCGSTKKVWWICDKGHEWSASIPSRRRGNKCPICSNRRIVSGVNDLQSQSQSLMLDWDFENNTISPSAVGVGSGEVVWWKCHICGYSWKARISSRSKNNTGCPSCAGKVAISGINDLATLFPDLLQEWDYTKNIDLDPTNVLSGSGKKVWWICSVCGEGWQAQISNRVHGTGCPYCAHLRVRKGINDFQTLFPSLAQEWDFDKNEISPDEVPPHYSKKVWWLCDKHHSYLMTVDKRTGSDHGKCPYCSNQKVLPGYNDLVTVYPEVSKEWDYQKNAPITPDHIAKKSNKKYWWKCPSCGRSYESTVNNRVTGHGCPYCVNQKVISGVNDLLTLYPEIAAEWDYKKNIISPNEVMSKSHMKAWWICPIGHSYSSQISQRTHNNTGCPICNGLQGTSFQEQSIYYYISKYVTAVNRYMIDNIEIDIFIPEYRIGIEYDGQFYHSSERAQKKETFKNQELEKHGIELFRVKESDKKDYSDSHCLKYVYREDNSNLDEVIKQLFNCLNILIPSLKQYDIDTERDRIEILGNYLSVIKKNSIAGLYPELIEEWDYEKNGALSPFSIGPGSHQKVWWKCKNEHSWQAQVKSRIKYKTGCPYCSKKKLLSGYNDLYTTNPELIEEWDYEKNEIDPRTITSGCKEIVWWKCSVCGVEWQARVYSRAYGTGCPVCGRKKALRHRYEKHGY